MNVQLDPVSLLRAKYEKNYLTGRSNLLLVIIFTLISMVTYALDRSYFLFSAYIPLVFYGIFADLALVTGGDTELAAFYEWDAEFIEQLKSIGAGTFWAIGIAIGVLLVGAYFLCWLFSKKHPAALIIAAVFFGIDCLMLLLNFDISGIMDILFHAWVMYYLINAIISNSKLKKLPAPAVEASFNEVTEPVTVEEWSQIDTAANNNSEQN